MPLGLLGVSRESRNSTFCGNEKMWISCSRTTASLNIMNKMNYGHKVTQIILAIYFS